MNIKIFPKMYYTKMDIGQVLYIEYRGNTYINNIQRDKVQAIVTWYINFFLFNSLLFKIGIRKLKNIKNFRIDKIICLYYMFIFNIPVGLPSYPIKIWGKSVQELLSYDRTNINRQTDIQTEITTLYLNMLMLNIAGLHENAAMLRSEEETRCFLSAVLRTQPHIDTAQENIVDNDIASIVHHLLAKVSLKFFSLLLQQLNSSWRNWVLATNVNFQIPIFLQRVVVHLGYSNLSLSDPN